MIKIKSKFQQILFIDSIMLNYNKKDNKDYTLLDDLYVPESILTLQVHGYIWSYGVEWLLSPSF